MKGSYLWKGMYFGCALLGMLAGYGLLTFEKSQEAETHQFTEDSTLNKVTEDSVFFVGKNQEWDSRQTESETSIDRMDLQNPDRKKALERGTKEEKADEPEGESGKNETAANVDEPEEESGKKEAVVKADEPEGESGKNETAANVEWSTEERVSVGSQWVQKGMVASIPSVADSPEDFVTETITYPAEIFGQVPVINRTDTYVSYFEFSYDLVSTLEPVVKERGLNLNALLAKFVVKALFCGIDVKKLDINEPIPRRLAALCLWLAAQVLNEENCNTSAKSAQKYVTDIENCSRSEKKAVAYLYEQGILVGYQMSGQSFFPEQGLKTEAGNLWISNAAKIWK